MSFNLIESIQSQLTPSVIQGAGRFVGAEPAATQRTFQAAVPAVVGGLVQQGSSSEGAGRLLSMLNREGGDADPAHGLTNGGTAQIAERGQGMLQSLFGDRLGRVTEAVGRFSAVGGPSATKLMGLVAPLAAGVLGKQVREQHLDAGGLQRLLGEQKESVAHAMPSGFGGVSTSRPAAAEPRRSRGILPIVLGLLAVFAVWSLLRGNRNREVRPVPQRTVTVVTRPAVPVQGAASGLEQAITGGAQVALPARFQLEGMNFDTGSARLQSSANEALSSVASVLKRHPGSRIRIEGFTDSAGGTVNNLQLSQQRADTVRTALLGEGVDARQVEARGYGNQGPISQPSNQAGAQERRTDVVLVAR